MSRNGKSNSELIESIAGEILDYLERHPNSADSIDGIAKWWLKRQRFEEAYANVQLAVRLLESAGKINKSCVSGGRVIYSARSLSDTPKHDDN